MGYRTKLCGVAFTLGVGFGLAAQANMRAPSFEEPPTLAVVPFRNLTGQSEAVPAVMNEVWRVLQDKGFVLAGNGRIDDFLRSGRHPPSRLRAIRAPAAASAHATPSRTTSCARSRAS